MKYYWIELETEQGGSHDEGYVKAMNKSDAFHEVNSKCQYWYSMSESSIQEISEEDYEENKHTSTWL